MSTPLARTVFNSRAVDSSNFRHHAKNAHNRKCLVPAPSVPLQSKSLRTMTEMASPSFIFTIPSIHDNTTLQCRIFHPATPSDNVCGITPKCYTRAAVIAHPYAPQGGCYDDPIVESVVRTLLQQDCIVGTFNFRGAGSSTSHTTWTGRAEIQDYISLAGLLICYIHSLRSLARPTTSTSPSPSPQTNDPITLILGGYSYGALIASMLPPLPATLLPFTAPSINTPIAEIRLRAEHLARERRLEENAMDRRRPRPLSRGRGRATDTLKPIAMGGEESTPVSSSRTSRESSRKRVEGAVRRSFDASRPKWRRNHHYDQSEGGGGESVNGGVASAVEGDDDDDDDDDDNGEASAMDAWRATLFGDTRTLSSSSSSSSSPSPQVRTAPLLVSPPLPPVSHFLTGFSSFFTHRDVNHEMGETAGRGSEGLVVYGDSDGFTSARKYRKWAAEVEEAGGNRFKFHEVAGAGHFYRERGALEGLLQAVGMWAGRAFLAEESSKPEVDEKGLI